MLWIDSMRLYNVSRCKNIKSPLIGNLFNVELDGVNAPYCLIKIRDE